MWPIGSTHVSFPLPLEKLHFGGKSAPSIARTSSRVFSLFERRAIFSRTYRTFAASHVRRETSSICRSAGQFYARLGSVRPCYHVDKIQVERERQELRRKRNEIYFPNKYKTDHKGEGIPLGILIDPCTVL